MVNLREYQTEAIAAIENTFLISDRQFIEMPTGAGKTITFLSYAKKNHWRIMIIVPSKELLKQVYDSALLFYNKSEISRKGNGYDEQPGKLHICIINSIKGKYLNYIKQLHFSLVIIDEAHHVQANSYRRLIESMVEEQEIHKEMIKELGGITEFLGVTATPDRADGKIMEDLLYTKSYKIEIEDLIDQKFLADVEGYIVKTDIDLSEIDDHNGDFSITQLYKKLSTEARNNIILNICQKEMKDRKTLVFCINIKHAIEISKSLNSIGISSKAIYGAMREEEKSSILSAFRRGEISCLCNCQLLTEGFDEPTIDGIVLARPTRSRGLFLQMIGRGLRTSLGKENCKIVDIVDNHRSLMGFNALLETEKYKQIESFKSIRDIRNHIEKEKIDSIQTKITRVNFFNINYLDDIPSQDCQLEYLDTNKINYSGLLSFDEASFLIWHNELRKQYYGSN
jgi:superfamily II DNA or RNA helicase